MENFDYQRELSKCKTLGDITKKWTSPYSNSGQTLSQFKIAFEDRIQLEI